MTDTLKVQGFLDLFGAWDPTLIFVLGGAIIPMFVAWRIAAIRKKSVLGGLIPLTPKTELDRSLITGAILFGRRLGPVGLLPWPCFSIIHIRGHRWADVSGSHAGGNGDCPADYPYG